MHIHTAAAAVAHAAPAVTTDARAAGRVPRATPRAAAPAAHLLAARRSAGRRAAADDTRVGRMLGRGAITDPPTGIAHASGAVLAMGSGAWILLTRKGTIAHRRVGWVYVASMV